MKEKYARALVLSRNFNSRTLEETKELYKTIQQAVAFVQKKGEESEAAATFLAKIYEPYIKKITGKFYPFVDSKLEFEDVLQEAYALFMVLIFKYNKKIASFSYYIKSMLPKHVDVWTKKINDTNRFSSIDIRSVEDTIYHPYTENSEGYFESKILEQEYINFIIERSKRSSRSDTVREVCNKIFLGNTTCSDLAKELNISYHAVYEIMNKIKAELKWFFSANQFSEFTMTSTGLKSSMCEYIY